MESAIQSALVVLGTTSGPSPVLDGVIDQIVSAGLPMIPVLIATQQGQSNADATARLLLSGVQRAFEHVDPSRKTAIIKGIAAHVCPSPALPWPVRAFGVKTLQSTIQSASFVSVTGSLRSEAVAAAVEAMAHIVHTAHIAELTKQFKLTDSSVSTPLSLHPYHSAEIKSAVDLFALLSEIDADTVATVFAPKQKSHAVEVANMVKAATVESSASAAVAQAIATRFDPIALGLPRTVGLRIALEKLNCEALIELSKSLTTSSGTLAFDLVMSVYTNFFGRSGKDDVELMNASAQDESSPIAAFAATIKRLTQEQGVSKETVGIFVKSQLKDALTRSAAELIDANYEPGLQSAWTQRLKVLSKNSMLAKVGGPLSSILADLVFGLCRAVSRSLAAGEVGDDSLILVREIEDFSRRSFGVVEESDLCSLHTRFGEGAEVLLRAVLPSNPTDEAPVSTNLPLLEATLFFVFAITPRPKRVSKKDAALGNKRQRAEGDEHDNDEGAEDTEQGISNKVTTKEGASDDIERFGVQKFLAPYSDNGPYLESLRTAYSILIEEVSTIDIAQKLKTLLGDKAPPAVIEGASASESFITLDVLQHRHDVVKNILALFRVIALGGLNIPAPSYDSSRRVLLSRDSHHQPTHHHHGGGRGGQYTNNRSNHLNNGPRGGSDRRGGYVDDRDYKRSRNEDRNGGRNGGGNYGSSSHHSNGRGYNHTSHSNDRRAGGHTDNNNRHENRYDNNRRNYRR